MHDAAATRGLEGAVHGPRRGWLAIALAAALLGPASACLPGTSEDAFIGGRSRDSCQSVYHLCEGKPAGCRLDEDEYVDGTFPGGRAVLVETPEGAAVIKVLIFLDPEGGARSPGTETEVNWYEPGCADQYRYRLSREGFGEDLFKSAGEDNVLAVEQAVTEPGDHLVEVFSDATTRYLLRIDVVQSAR